MHSSLTSFLLRNDINDIDLYIIQCGQEIVLNFRHIVLNPLIVSPMYIRIAKLVVCAPSECPYT